MLLSSIQSRPFSICQMQHLPHPRKKRRMRYGVWTPSRQSTSTTTISWHGLTRTAKYNIHVHVRIMWLLRSQSRSIIPVASSHPQRFIVKILFRFSHSSAIEINCLAVAQWAGKRRDQFLFPQQICLLHETCFVNSQIKLYLCNDTPITIINELISIVDVIMRIVDTTIFNSEDCLKR